MKELAVIPKGRGLLMVHETEYMGYDLIDIREHIRDDHGTLRPTRKGLSISRRNFGEFADMIQEVRGRLENGAGE